MTSYLISKNPAQCYGCRSCEHICPHHAILMKPNEEGFIYPELDGDKCTKCKLCSKVCPYDSPSPTHTPIRTVAAQYKDAEALNLSSSGGLFSAFADYVLSQNGFVAGCVFDDSFVAMHILTNSPELVKKMRGSKYVQSDLNDIYIQIQKKLTRGTLVLFSGTPCQIDGLRRFLKQDYDNLLTIDLICHGVPSPKLFDEYLRSTAKKRGKIIDIKFRDKHRNGWCSQGSITYSNKTKTITPFNDSYYYYYYLKNCVSRMCCYSCKYSTTQRVGDITIGDYWNISDEIPSIDVSAGFSAVMINTEKGRMFFENIAADLSIYETSLEAVVRGNGNLSRPSPMPENRKDIYSHIADEGYDKVAKKECKYQYIRPFIRKHIPKSIKKSLKKILR